MKPCPACGQRNEADKQVEVLVEALENHGSHTELDCGCLDVLADSGLAAAKERIAERKRWHELLDLVRQQEWSHDSARANEIGRRIKKEFGPSNTWPEAKRLYYEMLVEPVDD